MTILYVVLGVAILASLIYRGGATARRLRAVRRYAIADLPDRATARVVGTVEAIGEPLIAPLTGRACVYYAVTVRERERTRSRVIDERRGVPFVLNDASGRAIVDPAGATVELDFDAGSSSGTFDDPTPVEQAFLARHNEKGQRWLLNRELEYREAVIAIGETIAVLGSGVHEPDPDAARAATDRGPAPTRLRLSGSARFPLVISDVPAATK